MVNHANSTFFTAVDLVSQEKVDEAVAKFEQAIHLYSVIAASTAPLWLEFRFPLLLPSIFP